MKKKYNLFVCHSQAQLILAVGLVKGRFFNEENHLILFKDFDLKPEMKGDLDKIFDKTLYRIGCYPATNKSWGFKLKQYPSDLKSIQRFMNGIYEKVFVICDDAIPEIFILKRAVKWNPSVDLIWLEDGSHPYYTNGAVNDGFNSNKLTRIIRKIIFKYFFMLGDFYDFEGNFMGSNKNIKTVYLTFVGCERGVYQAKKKINISDNDYKLGIKKLFNKKLPDLDDKSVILVLDKIDVYKNLDLVKKLIEQISNILLKKKVKLYYKCHPREEDYLEEFESIEGLDKNIGIEYYYSSNLGKEMTVLGIKSTGLQASKKLGLNTISIAKIVNENNADLDNFYNKIGIHTPDSTLELKQLLVEKIN